MWTVKGNVPEPDPNTDASTEETDDAADSGDKDETANKVHTGYISKLVCTLEKLVYSRLITVYSMLLTFSRRSWKMVTHSSF